MGHVYCPGKENLPWLHTREIKCCWRCDRCPKEHGFRLLKGEYCPDCTKWFKDNGFVWDEYTGNYVKIAVHDNHREQLKLTEV